MDLNNLYNFKNAVRHFVDIDSLEYPDDVENFNTKRDVKAWNNSYTEENMEIVRGSIFIQTAIKSNFYKFYDLLYVAMHD